MEHEEDLEEAHYHFCLNDLVYYSKQFGIDKVMSDLLHYYQSQTQVEALEKKYLINEQLEDVPF